MVCLQVLGEDSIVASAGAQSVVVRRCDGRQSIG